MPKSEINLYCRVCGYKSDEPPWGDDGRTPLYDFCSCCGVEHGYQDSTLVSVRKFRGEWIAAGAPWNVVKERPHNWVLEEQLQHVPHEFE